MTTTERKRSGKQQRVQDRYMRLLTDLFVSTATYAATSLVWTRIECWVSVPARYHSECGERETAEQC